MTESGKLTSCAKYYKETNADEFTSFSLLLNHKGLKQIYVALTVSSVLNLY